MSRCVSILLESGADVHLRSEFIQETALHRLYRQNIDCLFTIYDSTKYLLTTGIEQEVREGGREREREWGGREGERICV